MQIANNNNETRNKDRNHAFGEEHKWPLLELDHATLDRKTIILCR